MNKKEKENNKKWFWGTSLSIILFSIIFIIFTSPTIRIISIILLSVAWGFDVFKTKQEKAIKMLNVVVFIISCLLSITYVATLVKEIKLAILSFLGVVGTIVVVATTLIFIISVAITKILTGDEDLLRIILPYFGLSLVVTLAFTGAYISVASLTETPLQQNAFYTSLATYYLKDSGLQLSGKLAWVSIIETIFSYLVHVIILGVAVSRNRK